MEKKVKRVDSDGVGGMKNRWIKEGMEVVHKDNPGLKLYVEEILVSDREVRVEGGERVVKRMIKGVRCYWFDGGRICQGIFHTKSLVPYEIGQMGYTAIVNFLRFGIIPEELINKI